MGNFTPAGDEAVDVSLAVRMPKNYKVLMHNDNYTTMEFVVDILQSIFHKNLNQATAIMMNIHEKGLGICGIFTEEIAETKVMQVHERARKAGFPLRCSLEEA